MVPGCVASGVVKKSKIVNFNPKENKISLHEFTADCGSPGAVGLIIQMLMNMSEI
jgi:RNA 3'-terminal phosphate cyclase